MRIRYVSGTLGMFFALYSNAQVVSDTIKSVDLSEVVVTGSYRQIFFCGVFAEIR